MILNGLTHGKKDTKVRSPNKNKSTRQINIFFLLLTTNLEILYFNKENQKLFYRQIKIKRLLVRLRLHKFSQFNF